MSNTHMGEQTQVCHAERESGRGTLGANAQNHDKIYKNTTIFIVSMVVLSLIQDKIQQQKMS